MQAGRILHLLTAIHHLDTGGPDFVCPRTGENAWAVNHGGLIRVPYGSCYDGTDMMVLQDDAIPDGLVPDSLLRRGLQEGLLSPLYHYEAARLGATTEAWKEAAIRSFAYGYGLGFTVMRFLRLLQSERHQGNPDAELRALELLPEELRPPLNELRSAQAVELMRSFVSAYSERDGLFAGLAALPSWARMGLEHAVATMVIDPLSPELSGEAVREMARQPVLADMASQPNPWKAELAEDLAGEES